MPQVLNLSLASLLPGQALFSPDIVFLAVLRLAQARDRWRNVRMKQKTLGFGAFVMPLASEVIATRLRPMSPYNISHIIYTSLEVVQ